MTAADEYTPTTDEVRGAAEDDHLALLPGAFDRWLAAHDAEVRKSARREFVQEIRDLGAGLEAATLHKSDEDHTR